MAKPLPALDTTRRWTADEVRALPDEVYVHCQLLNGELVVSPSPKPPHQQIVLSLAVQLANYLAPFDLQHTLYVSPADISWNQYVLVQPDVFVISPAEASGDWRGMKTLLLTVEVLSPSSKLYDRNVKRRIYQENGVQTYWIVDPFNRIVEVWHPGDEKPLVATEKLTWQAAPTLPALEISFALFMDSMPKTGQS